MSLKWLETSQLQVENYRPLNNWCWVYSAKVKQISLLPAIVTAVGFGLSVFLFTAAALLNWGATFASDSVKSQLDNQNISFPAADAMPEATKAQLAKWAEKKVTTGEMARDYSDLYIWEHMKGSAIAALVGGLVMLLLSIAGLVHIRRTPDSATI
ncbi:hypothetical protein MCEZE9_00835 [Candidatus Nanopelagicaceae bacterium]